MTRSSSVAEKQRDVPYHLKMFLSQFRMTVDGSVRDLTGAVECLVKLLPICFIGNSVSILYGYCVLHFYHFRYISAPVVFEALRK